MSSDVEGLHHVYVVEGKEGLTRPLECSVRHEPETFEYTQRVSHTCAMEGPMFGEVPPRSSEMACTDPKSVLSKLAASGSKCSKQYGSGV